MSVMKNTFSLRSKIVNALKREGFAVNPINCNRLRNGQSAGKIAAVDVRVLNDSDPERATATVIIYRVFSAEPITIRSGGPHPELTWADLADRAREEARKALSGFVILNRVGDSPGTFHVIWDAKVHGLDRMARKLGI